MGQIAAPCPVIPGHETVGTIESIGEVAALKWGVGVGDCVAVEYLAACGRCAQCLRVLIGAVISMDRQTSTA